jgi:hypothetical protein
MEEAPDLYAVVSVGVLAPLGGDEHVFDSLAWPTLMIRNGPPAMTNHGTLSESGRHARGTDAKEKSERGAVRGDQARI